MQFEIVQRLGVSEEFSERFVVGSSFTSLQCYCFHVGSHPGCALAQAFSELFHSYYKSFGLAHHSRVTRLPATLFNQQFSSNHSIFLLDGWKRVLHPTYSPSHHPGCAATKSQIS
jgi:hypothetical protein